MSIIVWIVLGGIIGWAASLISESDRHVFEDIVLGITGAVIGGWIMTLMSSAKITSFYFPSFLVAVVSSIVLIWISRAFRGNTRSIQ